MPAVWVCDASCPVAVGFVEYAEMEEDVVKQEEEEAPFQEGDVESFEAFCTEAPGIFCCMGGEEIAGCDEE